MNQVTYSGIARAEDVSLETDFIMMGIPALSRHPVIFSQEILTSMQQRLLDVIDGYHFPQGIESLFLLCLYNRASLDGHKVMLDGNEGDTVLGSGPIYIAYLLRAGNISKAMKEACSYSKNTYDSEISGYSVLGRSMKQAVMFQSVHRYLFSLKTILSGCHSKVDIPFNQSFANRVNLKSLLVQTRHQIGFGLKASPGEQHRHLFQRPFMGRMYNNLDMLSSPFSLELRHPYLDRRLVEFSLGLPWQLKNREGWEKWVLRKYSNHRVPETIRWRRRRSHVGWRFLNAFIELIEEELADIVHDRRSLIFEYLDYAAVQTMYKDYKLDKRNVVQLQLHHIYGVEKWLNNHANLSSPKNC
jgi:asparagine synthase (glutamine-hydrolysing)